MDESISLVHPRRHLSVVRVAQLIEECQASGFAQRKFADSVNMAIRPSPHCCVADGAIPPSKDKS
jgi:hypothetical protein